jgi:hypothetical protein
MSNTLTTPVNKISKQIQKSLLPVSACLLIANHSLSNDEDEVPYYLQLSKEQQEELSRELYRY